MRLPLDSASVAKVIHWDGSATTAPESQPTVTVSDIDPLTAMPRCRGTMQTYGSAMTAKHRWPATRVNRAFKALRGLSLAALLGIAGAVLSPSARAANSEPFWSATLKSMQWGGSTKTGWDKNVKGIGSLSNTDFTFRGTTYKITALYQTVHPSLSKLLCVLKFNQNPSALKDSGVELTVRSDYQSRTTELELSNFTLDTTDNSLTYSSGFCGLVHGYIDAVSLSSPPNAPTGFTATADNTDRVIDLAWSNPSDSSITEWQYKTKTGTYGNWQEITGSSATTTAHEVSGLANNTEHVFKIRAVNSTGNGVESSEAKATLKWSPGKPTGLTAAGFGSGVRLRWSDPKDNSITGYQYRRKTHGGTYGAWQNVVNSSASTVIHNVTGLTNNTRYWFQIRAVNVVGQGLESDAVDGTPVPAPAKPTNLTVTAGDSKVLLEWDNPSDDSIAFYQYSRTKDSRDSRSLPDSALWSVPQKIPNSNKNTTSFVVTGLLNDVKYSFRIRPRDVIQPGEFSDVVSATPKAVALTVSTIRQTTATLTLANHWAAWWYKGNQTGATCTKVAAGTSTADLTGLMKNTSYIYKAYGKAGCNSADEIASKSFTTVATTLCDRTPEVRDAIVAAVSGKSTCSAITDTDLAGITSLTVNNKSSLTALKPGDFAGMTALEDLYLNNNSLSSLPAGVFDKLTSLEKLYLNNNSLSSLPAGVFDKLTKLNTLYLSDNSLSSLRTGMFDKLTALRWLYLNDNSLSSLPAGVFDKLTKLEWLYLNDNSLSSLPAGVFDKLTTLDLLALDHTSLSSLPAGVFDKLTKLEILYLNNTSLSSLPAGVFDKLTKLRSLRLRNNSLGSLPTGVFDKLTALEALALDSTSLSSLPAGVFDKLIKLKWLFLGHNSLSSLPVGVFNNLTKLGYLSLSGNSNLTCLPFIPSSVTVLLLDKARSAYASCGAAVTVNLSSLSVAGNATSVYTLVLAAYPNGNVTVTPASSDTGKATVSGPLTFMQSNWSTPQEVTVTGVATGSATVSHTVSGGGYGSVTAANIAVTVTPATLTVNLCGRTPEIRDAIVAAVSGKSTCSAITDTDLARITSLTVNNKSSLTALKPDDFAGMTALTSLSLKNNSLSSLPAGVFDKLTKLKWLFLNNNSLSSLRAGVFDKLIKLELLFLDSNSLSSLPAGVFNKLTKLKSLYWQ